LNTLKNTKDAAKQTVLHHELGMVKKYTQSSFGHSGHLTTKSEIACTCDRY